MLIRRRTNCHTHFHGTNSLCWLGGLVIGVVLLVAQAGCAVPLLTASASGDAQKVLLLLQEGHRADDALPFIGIRPLILAASSGDIETVTALLEAGADVNGEDFTGWTALHAGAFHGQVSVVSLLLERGAVPGESRWFIQSPVEIAEALGHEAVVQVLKQTDTAFAHDRPVSINKASLH
jgi:ankyrin repeat protein